MAEATLKRLHSELSPEQEEMEVSCVKIKTILQEVLQSYGLNIIKAELQDIKKSLQYVQESSEEAFKIATECKTEVKEMETQLSDLQNKLKQESENRLKLETHSRRSNLRFYGIPETEASTETDTDCEYKIQEVIKSLIGTSASIERCHRLGPRPKTNNKFNPRPIIAKFSLFKERQQVWQNKVKLKGSKVVIKEDYPLEIEKRIQVLSPIFMEARRRKIPATLTTDKLFINKTMYTVQTINRLPPELQLQNIFAKQDENKVLFWSKHSPLSNFFTDCTFQEGASTYNCVEQYFCAQKAAYFNDHYAKEKIMNTTDPAVQKRVNIEGFNAEQWKGEALEIMKRGLLLKFEQNHAVRNFLLSTGNKLLCEASSRDSYWGAGIGINDPRIQNTSLWGQNNLGKLLMSVREELK